MASLSDSHKTKPRKKEDTLFNSHSKSPHSKMEVQSPSAKRHYDITMSRRTRKQQQQQQSFNQVHQANEKKPTQQVVVVETKNEVSQEKVTTTQTNNNNVDDHHEVVKKEECESDDHKSLKQLIKKDEKLGGRKELGEHFTEEEKNLPLVTMQQKDNIQGVKFKKLVRRYAKVLGHLMKAKRDPPLGDAGKKPPFKLSS